MKIETTLNDQDLQAYEAPLNAAALAAVHAAAIGAGYKLGNETKKLRAFEAPNGQIIYLDKLHTNLNDIRLIVHPRHEREALVRLDEAATVSSDHRFHSNMTGFPKRINRGKTPTSYGWQIRIGTSGTLSRFLSRFAAYGL